MSRPLLEQIKEYLSLKNNRTQQEQNILDQVSKDLENFYMYAFTRDEIKEMGYDITHISDDDLQELADRCGNDWRENIKSISLPIIANHLEFRAKDSLHCPKCGTAILDLNSVSVTPNQIFISCDKCDFEKDLIKSDLWVLAEHPDNTVLLQKMNIGFPSYESQDRCARYVKEEDFIKHLGKEPAPNQYYGVVRIKDEDKPEKFDEYAEPIEEDLSVAAFGDNAYWVAVCYL